MADPLARFRDETQSTDPLARFRDGAQPEPQSSGALGTLKDIGITGLKSAIGVPEAALGLADIVTSGRAGKTAENLGFRPKEAKEILSSYYSPEQQAKQQAVRSADGFLPTLKSYAQNPSVAAHDLGEQIAPILGGGVLAQGVRKVLPKVAPYVAGAIGEGALTAGQNIEQVRQETPGGLLDPMKQTLPIVASGALTGAIAAGSGRIADKLGITDIQNVLAGGQTRGGKGIVKNILGTTFLEGVGQELPQSMQEQVAQNYALEKPLTEGVGTAAAQGLVLGSAMGAGGAIIDPSNYRKGPLTNAQTQPPAPQWQPPGYTDTKFNDIRRPTWTEPSYANKPNAPTNSNLSPDGQPGEANTAAPGQAMGGSGTGIGTVGTSAATTKQKRDLARQQLEQAPVNNEADAKFIQNRIKIIDKATDDKLDAAIDTGVKAATKRKITLPEITNEAELPANTGINEKSNRDANKKGLSQTGINKAEQDITSNQDGLLEQPSNLADNVAQAVKDKIEQDPQAKPQDIINDVSNQIGQANVSDQERLNDTRAANRSETERFAQQDGIDGTGSQKRDESILDTNGQITQQKANTRTGLTDEEQNANETTNEETRQGQEDALLNELKGASKDYKNGFKSGLYHDNLNPLHQENLRKAEKGIYYPDKRVKEYWQGYKDAINKGSPDGTSQEDSPKTGLSMEESVLTSTDSNADSINGTQAEVSNDRENTQQDNKSKSTIPNFQLERKNGQKSTETEITQQVETSGKDANDNAEIFPKSIESVSENLQENRNSQEVLNEQNVTQTPTPNNAPQPPAPNQDTLAERVPTPSAPEKAVDTGTVAEQAAITKAEKIWNEETISAKRLLLTNIGRPELSDVFVRNNKWNNLSDDLKSKITNFINKPQETPETNDPTPSSLMAMPLDTKEEADAYVKAHKRYLDLNGSGGTHQPRPASWKPPSVRNPETFTKLEKAWDVAGMNYWQIPYEEAIKLNRFKGLPKSKWESARKERNLPLQETHIEQETRETEKAPQGQETAAETGITNETIQPKQTKEKNTALSYTEGMPGVQKVSDDTGIKNGDNKGQVKFDILGKTKKQYILDQKRAWLKEHKNALPQAKAKAFSDLETNYDIEIERAHASLPFEQYKDLPENKGQSDGVLRQVHEQLQADYGVAPDIKDESKPQEAKATETSMQKTAADLANDMQNMRNNKPRSLKQLFGKTGPTLEQKAAHEESEKKWNAAYRKLSKLQKETLEKENAEFREKNKPAQKTPESIAEDVSKKGGKEDISKDDIPYDKAYDAYRGISFDPEKRAASVQNEYVRYMQSVYDDVIKIAKTDEQKATIDAAFQTYKQGYIQKQLAHLAAKSRVLSPMITGPANFPVARNNKANATEHKRLEEWDAWDKKAVARLKEIARNTRSKEEIKDEQFEIIRKGLASSLSTIKGIDDGTVKGSSRALFVNNLTNRIKTLAKNGLNDLVNKSLDYIENYQKDLPKPLISPKHSIWELRKQASEVINQPDKATGQETLKTYQGAEVVNNFDAERVQILFDEKPSEAVRTELKKNGFNWSPSNSAWQRKNTTNGVASAKRVLDGLYQDSDAKLSQNTPATGSTRAELVNLLNANDKKLLQSGRLNVVQSVSDIPKAVLNTGDRLTRKNSVPAWHGSPHDHNKFDSSKIGTGEGAQAFGYGHYFTDKKEIAEWYRTELSTALKPDYELYIDGVKIPKGADRVLDYLSNHRGDFDETVAYFTKQYEEAVDQAERFSDIFQDPKSHVSEYKMMLDFAEGLEESGQKIEVKNKNSGKLYQVELAPEQDELLDWDKPLSEQSEKVKEALNGYALNDSLTGEDIHLEFALHKNNAGYEGAAKELHQLGIRGIRYKAEQGRSDAYNYVIFSDDDISIKEKYSKDEQIEGFYKDGKIYIIADNVTPENLPSVLLHEKLHASLDQNPKLRERLLGAQSELNDIFDLVESGEYTGRYKELYDAAMKRVDRAGTSAEARFEEFLAYSISEHNKSTASMPARLAKAIQNLISAIKAAIFRYSGYIGKISPADLSQLAQSAMSYSENPNSSNDIKFSIAPPQKSSLWTRWFGKSKMKRGGEPIKFYHGSNADFTVFDKGDTKSTRHPSAELGHFFAEDKGTAYTYGGKVHEVYLSMQNPYIITSELLDQRMGDDPAKFAAKLKQDGFDGIYIKDAKYAVIFDSNQAKLTSNESPTFGSDIRYSIADDVKDLITGTDRTVNSLSDIDTILQTGKMPQKKIDMQSVMDKAATMLVDATRPFDVLMRKIPNIELASHVVRDKDLAKRRVAVKEKEALDTFLKPLAKIIGEVSKDIKFDYRATHQIMGEWMTVRYALEKNKDYIRQDQEAVDQAQDALNNDPTNSQLKSALTRAKNAQKERLDAINEQKWIDPKSERLQAKLAGGYNNFTAKAQMAKYEGVISKVKLEEAAKHVYAMNKWKTALDLSTGKVTQEQIDKWFNSPHYVPLTGDPSIDTSEDELFSHGSVNQQTDKRAIGRTGSIAQNGIDAAVEQVQKSARYYGWGDFKDSLYNLYDGLIQEELDNGATMREAQDAVMKNYQLSRSPLREGFVSETGITYRKGNEKWVFDLHNQEAVDALKSINKEEIPSLLQPIANFTRTYSRFVTQLMPGFGAINAIRDTWERTENIRARALPGYETLNMNKVANDAIKNASHPSIIKKLMGVMLEGTGLEGSIAIDPNDADIKNIREMIKAGATSTVGDYLAQTNKDLSKQMKDSLSLSSKGWGYVNAWNNAFELVSTYSLYKSLKDNGVDTNTAAAGVLNLMNFSKSGTITGPLKALYVFTNPIFQGGNQLIKTLSTPVGQKRAAAYLLAGMALYGMLRAIDGDDDELGENKMDNQSSFMLERNIHIPFGDVYIKIPIGFGMPQAMWSAAINLDKMMFGTQDIAETAVEIVKSFSRTLAPVSPSEASIIDHPIVWLTQTLTPQIAKPIMNVGMDVNMFGQPLTNTRFARSDKALALQGRKSTPEEYKDIAANLGKMGINVYPEQVREIVRGYAVGPFNEVIKAFVENPNKELLGRNTVNSLVDRFVSSHDTSGLKERLYYRYRDEMNQVSVKHSLGKELSQEEAKLLKLHNTVKKLESKANGKLAAATKAENKRPGFKSPYRKEGERIRETAMNLVIKSLH